MMAVRTAFNFFCDCWYLYRKYIPAELNEKAMDEFVEASQDIFRKYEQEPLAKDILLAISNEVDRISKQTKGEKNSHGKDIR